MICLPTQPRIPTEEVTLKVPTFDNGEKYVSEITWGEIWAIQPGYPLELVEAEIWWRNRYNMLLRRGYRLLPRYSPDWKPSWIKPYDTDPYSTAETASFRPDKYEDTVAVPMNGSTVPAMFATRLLDGVQVVIKRVCRLDYGFDNELKTMLLVSSEALRDDPMNHCIQLLEWFPVEDDVEPERNNDRFAFAVMPLLRDWRLPSFRLTMESLEFVSQMLEGLVFMHRNNITHGDIRSDNIGMDPSTMFPSGMNPLVNATAFLGLSRSPREPQLGRKDRIDVPVKYLFFDFGESLSFPSFEERSIARAACSSHSYPELGEMDESLPEGQWWWHDPFPAEIYVMGSELEASFYKDLPFLRPLIDSMHQEDPKARPTAIQCLEQFQEIKSRLSRWALLSPASNMLHPCYGYEHRWHKVKDVAIHWFEYIRLLLKVVLTKNGRRLLNASLRKSVYTL